MSHSMDVVRRHLRHAKYLLLSVLLGGLFLAMAPLVNAAERQLAPAPMFLDIEGQFAGWVHRVQGGTKVESGITNVLGPATATKLATSPEIEDLRFEFGGDMAPIWWKWVNESLGVNPGRTHNIAVVRTDIEGRQIDRRVLRQARIKEVQFPIVDAASKDLAYFEVAISVESSQNERLVGQAGPPPSKARALHGSNFRFELGHLSTDWVFKVAPPVVSIKFTKVRVGTSRTSTFTTPTVSVGNMIVSLPVHRAAAWIDWANVVINAGVPQEIKLQSSLSLLTPDLKKALMRIYFDQVELVEVSVADLEANAVGFSSMQVKLNVERVRVEMGR